MPNETCPRTRATQSNKITGASHAVGLFRQLILYELLVLFSPFPHISVAVYERVDIAIDTLPSF